MKLPAALCVVRLVFFVASLFIIAAPIFRLDDGATGPFLGEWLSSDVAKLALCRVCCISTASVIFALAGVSVAQVLGMFVFVGMNVAAGFVIRTGMLNGLLWHIPGVVVPSLQEVPHAMDIGQEAFMHAIAGILLILFVFSFGTLAKKGWLAIFLLIQEGHAAYVAWYYFHSLYAVAFIGVLALITFVGAWRLEACMFAIHPTKYSQRVVVITGAASGMGAELAKQYAKGGAKLLLFDLNDCTSIMQECQKLTGFKGSVVAQRGDVTDENHCKEAAKIAKERFGHVNTLILAAGLPVMHERFVDIQDMDKFFRVMDVNYKGSVMMTKAFLPMLLDNKKSWLIAFGSASSLFGVPYISGYSASKHAVLGFFDSLRIELAGTGCTVTVTCPHFVSTPMFNHYKTSLMLDPSYVVNKTRVGNDFGVPTVVVGSQLLISGYYANVRAITPGLNDIIIRLQMRMYASNEKKHQ